MARKLAQFLLALLTLILLSPKLALAQSPTPAPGPHFEFLSQPLTFYASDSVVSGNKAYVAAREDLYVLDITHPDAPNIKGSYHVDNCHFGAIDLVEPDVIVTQNFYGCPRPYNFLAIIDASDPSNPDQVGESIDIAPGAAYELAVEDGYAFVANGAGGLTIVNLSSRDTYSFHPSGTDFEDIKVAGNIAYLTDGSHKLWLLDISDKENINASDVLDTLEFSNHVTGVDVAGNYAYVSLAAFLPGGNGGLGVINVANPRDIYEAGRTPMPDPHAARDVEVEGNYAFVVDDHSKLVAFDISVPSIPTPVAEYLMSDESRLTVSGDLILASNGFGGLVILRFTGLSTETGAQLNVPLFKQNDRQWGSLEYNSGYSESLWCGDTIEQCGCALTSIAMVLKYFQVDKDYLGNPTNPLSVNNYFNLNRSCGFEGCISKGYSFGKVVWSAAGEYSADAKRVFTGQKKIGLDLYMDSYSPSIVSGEILAGKPVILRVPADIEHWVLATGIQGETFTINDPFYPWESLDNMDYGNTALAVRSYKEVDSDYSRFEVNSLAPTQVLVTDKYGRKTGYDSVTSSVVQEIPNSVYSFEPSYGDPTGTEPAPEPGSGVYSVLILTPEIGEYTVDVFDTTADIYSFAVYGSNRDAKTIFDLYEGEKQPLEERRYYFTFDPDQQEKILSLLVDVEIKPGSIQNPVLLNDKKGIIPVAILSSDIFDATSIDHASVRLLGAMEAHVNNKTGLPQRHEEDANGDGRDDLVMHFSLGDLIGVGLSTEWTLTGKTFDGQYFEGKDKVWFMSPKS